MIYLKRILSFIVLAATLLVLILAASRIFFPKNNTSSAGMEEDGANGILSEKENTVDVVVIGDSESYYSISPMQIWKEKGYTSYVCGTSAQTLDYSLTMLERAFKTQKPRIVIFETNAIYREFTESNALLTKLGNIFPIFRYHNRWKSLSSSDFTSDLSFTWTNDLKGFVYNTEVDGCENTDYMAETGQSAHIPEQNLAYVKKIKALCDENDAQLIFLSTPSSLNWNATLHNGISSLADELGCTYVDMNLQNDEIKINWETDTRDKGDHLNYTGAAKVTHYLADYLEKTGLLTDHRSDETYSSWNDSLTRYEAATSAG